MRTKRFLQLLSLASLCLLLTSCIDSKVPLSDPDKSKTHGMCARKRLSVDDGCEDERDRRRNVLEHADGDEGESARGGVKEQKRNGGDDARQRQVGMFPERGADQR